MIYLLEIEGHHYRSEKNELRDLKYKQWSNISWVFMVFKASLPTTCNAF